MTKAPPPSSADHAFHLGDPALDLEHQGQLDLLLDIEAEIRANAKREKLAASLDRLIEFTSLHFMSEQLLMRQQAYPGLPDHEAEHDELMAQMRDFQAGIAAGDRVLTATDLAALHDWVLRHIHTQDAAFADYVAREKQAGPEAGQGAA
ncbi:MAG: hemerythrin family protein [Xanthobacteraceae bacterium]